MACLRDSLGQMDGGRGFLNGEYPSVARHIPIKLIVVGEKSDFAIYGVGEFIGVLTGRNKLAAFAHVNAQAIRDLSQVKVLRLVVALKGDDFKMDGVGIAKPIVVASGDVPIDFMLDLRAHGKDLDGLAHQKRAVRIDGDVAVIGKDLLTGRRRGSFLARPKLWRNSR